VLREEAEERMMSDIRKTAESMKCFGPKTKLTWMMDEYRFRLDLYFKNLQKVPRHLTDVCVKGSGDLNCPG
jgi:hypothetical protein